MKIYAKFFKRIIDIAVSIVMLPIIVIIGIPVVAAIKIDDGGSLFYVSPRYGKDMKRFQMYKFRSMKENSEDIRNKDGTTYNSELDPRMTKVGRILRKTSIDELPQFINVLKGDMSIIGPRPSPMGNEKTYTEFIKKKFSVRPGITGLNQARNRNSGSLDERYKNDVYYAEHVSFGLDVKIFIMTIKSVLLRKNIYNS